MGGKLLIELAQDDICNIYSEWKSSGEYFIAGYEGIPQNLVINIICAIGVIIGFSFARRLLWDYGRIAVIERKLPKWKEEFIPGEPTEGGEDGGINIRLTVDYEEYKYTRGSLPKEKDVHYYDDEIGDTGLFSWIRITFMLTEDVMFEKCGPSACLYLRYQRHLIFLSSLICLCSTVVILPIHIVGEQLRGRRTYQPGSFAQTTLANVPSDSPIIWVHSVMAFVYFLMTFFVMNHFTRSLRPESKEDEVSHRTVTILGIQRRMCHVEKILAHIKEIYPTSVVRECTFAYDTSKLFSLENFKTRMLLTLKTVQDIYERKRDPPQIHDKPRLVMGLLWWLWCAKQVDALDYYANEVHKYKELVDYERARTLGRPLGICFVTFRTAFTAERMLNDYGLGRRLWDRLVSFWGPIPLDRTPQSTYSRKMRAQQWSIFRAPTLRDIHWENYGLSLLPWYLRAIMVNFTVILLALFFSTPIILIKTINYYVTIKEGEKGIEKRERGLSFSSLFFELFPTLIIWLAAVLLPCLVSVSDRLIGFWTRTAENRSRMIKTFTFLVTMVIILPSLGLSSLLYAVGTKRLKWECIYSPSNAAFYMNYVITSCFLGTTTELWRFPELFYILCLQLWKKSSYENPGIREATLWEFQIGSQYAWMMLVFAVFTVFSLISPLITPLGVLYMMIKYYVDKHNIFFAYAKCHVDNAVHRTAVNFVICCMFLLLTITFVFTNIAWTDQTFGHNLQFSASKFFVLVLIIIVCWMYGDLTGTIGTIIYEAKELFPRRSGKDREEKDKGRKPKGKSRKPDDEFEETFLYKTVSKIPIQPQHRYFAPMLRKDFPFLLDDPDSNQAPTLTREFDELLLYAEISLHNKPIFDHLLGSISNLNVEAGSSQRGATNQQPPPITEKRTGRPKRFHFNPVVKYRGMVTVPQSGQQAAAVPPSGRSPQQLN